MSIWVAGEIMFLSGQVQAGGDPQPDDKGNSDLLHTIALGMQQLQQAQIAMISKKGEMPESVKPGTTQLPSLAAPGSPESPVVVQGWLELIDGPMSDLSDNSGEWWGHVKVLANAQYVKWVASTPLEKTILALPEGDYLETGAYSRAKRPRNKAKCNCKAKRHSWKWQLRLGTTGLGSLIGPGDAVATTVNSGPMVRIDAAAHSAKPAMGTITRWLWGLPPRGGHGMDAAVGDGSVRREKSLAGGS
eukprot:s7374_g1.t1